MIEVEHAKLCKTVEDLLKRIELIEGLLDRQVIVSQQLVSSGQSYRTRLEDLKKVTKAS